MGSGFAVVAFWNEGKKAKAFACAVGVGCYCYIGYQWMADEDDPQRVVCDAACQLEQERCAILSANLRDANNFDRERLLISAATHELREESIGMSFSLCLDQATAASR